VGPITANHVPYAEPVNRSMLNVDVSRCQTRKSRAPPTPADALPATSILLCLLNAELRGHVLALDDAHRRRAENQRHRRQVWVEAGHGQKLPARVLHPLEEQVLDDDIRLGHLEPGQGEGFDERTDAVALLLQEFAQEVKDLLRVVDNEDVGLPTISSHGGAFQMTDAPDRRGLDAVAVAP
jgi:hypothetical protein